MAFELCIQSCVVFEVAMEISRVVCVGRCRVLTCTKVKEDFAVLLAVGKSAFTACISVPGVKSELLPPFVGERSRCPPALVPLMVWRTGALRRLTGLCPRR